MDSKNKSIGYKAGYALGVVLISCVCSIVIGMTIKLLLWMF